MNQMMKKRLVGAGVLTAILLVFALLFFRGGGAPVESTTESSDLADVRSYTIEVPTVPEQPPQEILATDPPIGTLLPGQTTGPGDSAQKDDDKPRKSTRKSASKPKPAEVAAGPVVPDVGWSVQVGSFSSRENADRQRQQLKDKGYPAFVYRNAAEHPPLFRVRVGPYLQQDEAKANAQRLREELRLDVLVVANG